MIPAEFKLKDVIERMGIFEDFLEGQVFLQTIEFKMLE